MGIKEWFEDAWDDVKKGAVAAGKYIEHTATNVANKVEHTVSNVVDLGNKVISHAGTEIEKIGGWIGQRVDSVGSFTGNFISNLEKDVNDRLKQGEGMLPDIALYLGIGAAVLGGIYLLGNSNSRTQSYRKRSIEPPSSVADDYLGPVSRRQRFF